MPKKKQTVCDLFEEISTALYHIYDVRPREVDYESYEDLYLAVEGLKEKLGCPKERKR